MRSARRRWWISSTGPAERRSSSQRVSAACGRRRPGDPRSPGCASFDAWTGEAPLDADARGRASTPTSRPDSAALRAASQTEMRRPSHPSAPGAISAAAPEERDGWDGVTKPRAGPAARASYGRHRRARASRGGQVDAAIATRAHSRQHARAGAAGDQGAISHDQLARAIAERHGLDHLDLTVVPGRHGRGQPDRRRAARKRYDAVPVAFLDERTLLVAMADPANVLAIDDIAMMTGIEVRPAVASREDIAALDRPPGRASTTSSRDARGGRAEDGRPRSSICASGRRRAGHQAREPDHRPGGGAGRVGHPLRAGMDASARSLPHRRRAERRRTTCRGAWSPASCRASRSWPTSTSPSGASRRTAASA